MPHDPLAVLRSYVEKYGPRLGLPAFDPNPSTLKVDPELGARAGLAFEALKHEPTDPAVVKAYDALKKELRLQHAHILSHGVKIEPWTKEGQPYANSKEMAADVRDNGHLSYFPTSEGFGEDARFNDHPLFEEVPGMPGIKYNDLLRGVHDYFAHAVHGHQFGPQGELRAWHEHAKTLSPLAKAALTTETHGQNSWVNFGPHNPQALKPQDRPFADQKAALLPKDAWPQVHDGPEKLARTDKLGFLEQDEKNPAEIHAWATKSPGFAVHSYRPLLDEEGKWRWAKHSTLREGIGSSDLMSHFGVAPGTTGQMAQHHDSRIDGRELYPEERVIAGIDEVPQDDITNGEIIPEYYHLARAKVPAGGQITGGGTQTGGQFQQGGQFAARARARIRATVAAWARRNMKLAEKKPAKPKGDLKIEELKPENKLDVGKSKAKDPVVGSIAKQIEEVKKIPENAGSEEHRGPLTIREMKQLETSLGLPKKLKVTENRAHKKKTDAELVSMTQEEAANWLDNVSKFRMKSGVKKSDREVLRDPNLLAKAKLAYLADHLTHEAAHAKTTFADSGGADRWYGDNVAVMARHLHDQFHGGNPGDNELWGEVEPETGRVKYDPNKPDPAGITIAKLLVAATSGGQKPDANYATAHKMMTAGRKYAAGSHDIFSPIPDAQHDDLAEWIQKVAEWHAKNKTGVTEDEIRTPGKKLDERTQWYDKIVKPLPKELGGISHGNNNNQRHSGLGVTYVDDPGGPHHRVPVVIDKGKGVNVSPYPGFDKSLDPNHKDALEAPEGIGNYSGELFRDYANKGKLRKAKIPATDENGKLKAPGWTARNDQVLEDVDMVRSVIDYFREKAGDDRGAMKAAADFFLTPQADEFKPIRAWIAKHPRWGRLSDAFERAVKENQGFFFPGEPLPGAFMLGPKFGAFANNLHLDAPAGKEWDARRAKYGQHLTADMWWSRTWNRYLGSMFGGKSGKNAQETPRNDTERKVMRKAAHIAAERAGLNNVAELQAVLWYYEQQMYRWLGVATDSKSYEDGVNRIAGRSGEQYRSDKLTGKVIRERRTETDRTKASGADGGADSATGADAEPG